MKTKFILIMAAVAALTSCNKNNYQTPDGPAGFDNENCRLTVRVDNGTKLTGIKGDATDEKKVNNLQLYIFKYADDQYEAPLEAYSANSGQMSISADCTTGDKYVFVLGNSNAEAKTCVQDIYDLTTDLFEDNSKNGFLMMGSTTLEGLEGESTETIEIKRLVSRVTLGSITRNFASGAMAKLSFKIKRIYLSNVVSKINYLLDDISEYVNEDSELDCTNPLICDAPNASLANGATYSTKHFFYTYHTVEEAEHKPRIVIEAEIDGRTYYYTINFYDEMMESNCSYNVSNVKLTRLGGDSPDDPNAQVGVSFNVQVADWEDEVDITEPIEY